MLRISIFGLTISSAWGNGHATPYRAILRALHRRAVQVTFYERDLPYYAARRDFSSCDYCRLVLYRDWNSLRERALKECGDSDIVMTASYCPEGARINDEVLGLDGPLRVFYDLDTPVTLAGLAFGPLDYLRRDQIPGFDLYLSFTGGPVLHRLQQEFGARLARALYGCVDPDVYHRVTRREKYACSLSYMGTYATDRQNKLEQLFLVPAAEQRDLPMVLAGSMYPAAERQSWPANVRHLEHVPPEEHPALYSSCRATLNITRREMANAGYCPSGRFFEAAACGTPIFTDWWRGLDCFFDVSRELAVVDTAADVLSQLARPDLDLLQMAGLARSRTLEQHTGDRRADDLLNYCQEARWPLASALEVSQ